MNPAPLLENDNRDLFPEANFPIPMDFALRLLRRTSRPQCYDSALTAILNIMSDEEDHGVPTKERSAFLSRNGIAPYCMLIFNGIGEKVSDTLPGAQQIHKLGDWNVFLPRLPRHEGDGVYGSKKDLTLEDLLLFIEEIVPIAQQLGEKLVIAGVSLGGLMATLAATRFANVIDEALIVQPPLLMKGIPESARGLIVDLVRLFKESDRLPLINMRAPGGSSHAVATGGELVLFLESVLAQKAIPPHVRLNVRYDEADEMFGSEGGTRLLKLLNTQNKVLEEWEFPFHTIKGDNPDWGPAYKIIFDSLTNFAKEFQSKN